MDEQGLSQMATMLATFFRNIVKEEITPLYELVESLQLKGTGDELLSIKEALKLFNPSISRGTLHRYTKQHKVKEHRVGKRVFYSKNELLESIKSIRRFNRY